MSRDIQEAITSFLEAGATPVILYYGDTIWRKRWIGYELISLPGGKEYKDSAILEIPIPEIKAKRGDRVTQNRHGFCHHGVGVVAANLTEVGELDKLESLKLIFNADKMVSGIAFITPQNDFLYWIDRQDVSGL